MLKIPELAMPRSRQVTTVCNGRREVWTDYEQAKAYFLEMMMSTEGEDRDRAECIYILRCFGSHRHTGSPLMDFMLFSRPHTSQPTSRQ